MKGIETVAELMAISARTAPKAKGEDYTLSVSGKSIYFDRS